MSIRLRTINGTRIALCAAETNPMPGDTHLDDADHYALSAKFAHDWQDRGSFPEFTDEWAVMETQKLRDARQTLEARSRDVGHD